MLNVKVHNYLKNGHIKQRYSVYTNALGIRGKNIIDMVWEREICYNKISEGKSESDVQYFYNVEDVVECLFKPVYTRISSQKGVIFNSQVVCLSSLWRMFVYVRKYTFDEFAEEYPEYFI